MTTKPIDLDVLRVEHARLTDWLIDSAPEKVGTPEYRRVNLTHRLMTDLLARNGGSADDRAYVAKRLIEIHAP